MPSLITYERKRLTEAQYRALGSYITRKRRKEELENGTTADDDNEKQASPTVQDVIPDSPVKPTAREIREQKQQELNDIQEQLKQLRAMLSELKKQKHECFEEVKNLVDSKKHEEKEKQMQGFPSPFIHHPGISPGTPMVNTSPFRPGMKRPRSPSPPLVQLYSPHPMPSNMPPFPPMGTNRVPGPPENMNQGYQFQQGYPQRDIHHRIQGPHVNLSSHPPPPPGNQFPTPDRSCPPFGSSAQMTGHQNAPRPPPPPANKPPFIQQKKRDSYGPNRSSHFAHSHGHKKQ